MKEALAFISTQHSNLSKSTHVNFAWSDLYYISKFEIGHFGSSVFRNSDAKRMVVIKSENKIFQVGTSFKILDLIEQKNCILMNRLLCFASESKQATTKNVLIYWSDTCSFLCCPLWQHTEWNSSQPNK